MLHTVHVHRLQTYKQGDLMYMTLGHRHVKGPAASFRLDLAIEHLVAEAKFLASTGKPVVDLPEDEVQKMKDVSIDYFTLHAEV